MNFKTRDDLDRLIAKSAPIAGIIPAYENVVIGEDYQSAVNNLKNRYNGYTKEDGTVVPSEFEIGKILTRTLPDGSTEEYEKIQVTYEEVEDVVTGKDEVTNEDVIESRPVVSEQAVNVMVLHYEKDMPAKTVPDANGYPVSNPEYEEAVFAMVTEALADKTLIPTEKFFIKQNLLKSENNTGGWEAPIVLESEVVDFVRPIMIKSINALADLKTKDAMNVIAGDEVSEQKLNRYKIKYDEAIKAKANNDFTTFNLEANLLGIDAPVLVDKVIEAGENWNTTMNNYATMIDAVRVKVSNMTKEASTKDEIYAIDNLLRQGAKLGSTTTIDDILNMLS